MKLVRNTLLLLLVAGTFACSNKDFLQRDPGVAITDEAAFSDPVLATRFADNTYNYLLDDYGRLSTAQVYKGTTGQFTDEAVFAEILTVHGVVTMNQGNFQDGASTDVNAVYTRMYQGIRNANVMLSRVDGITWTAAQNGKLIRAQQLYLRAFFYFELVKRYGGVILLDKPLDQTDNLDLPRNTYEETVAFILKDLQEAESILTTETWGTTYSPTTDWDAGNTGRATIGSVRALRTRLLMLDASPLRNPTGDAAKWQKAAAAAKTIIDMGKYSLHSQYGTLLNQSSSPEYIQIKVRGPRSGNGGFLGDFIIPPSAGGAQGQLNPTQNHVDLYEMSNGKPITDPTSGYNPQEPYKDRDPRFYANIIYNDMTWQGRKIAMWVNNATTPVSYGADYQPGSTSYTRTRYYLRKVWPEAVRGGTGGASAIVNFIFFRYGEVLLNYAEALNESDGPTAAVYTAVNQIRTRAGMPGLPAGLTKDQMRARIHNERAVELAFEEFRWWDILRWKKGVEIIPKTITGMDVERTATGFKYTVVPLAGAYQRVFADHMHVYPIPRNEIFKSNGVLKQNPGW
ncbi:RagB/SusD family nutrient uptake outer membrane protein [Fibrivirga algicola]|uniref:RagB/SusD family nutrient uptake outer membrane protein n=1 Tax=Fibrivirga algicola TaxID=2950420 RepID=A0ABX0QF04_9BACT|nr:RagB/SusD family nutrient uptake outer membrane protein [Fibrivirga algicola]NID09318.1 RagB/SusD family nutrient uptake outer membrane protein [Fibrivirga algicola]